MKQSSYLTILPPGQPMTNGQAKSILSCYHDDCLVKVIVDGQLRDITEVRQVSTGTGETIIHAFVV